MKKSKAKKKMVADMVEPDFTHSRAGLNTHRKNTAEQHRLEDKLRSLDLLQRRSCLQHQNEERSILQTLLPSRAPKPSPGASSRGEDNPGEVLCPSRVGRRASLQLDPGASLSGDGGGNPGRNSRRPSIVLQEVSSQPVLDVSEEDPNSCHSDTDHDTIIDILAARNKPRNARRASIGGGGGRASSLGSDLNLNLSLSLLSDTLKDNDRLLLRRQRSASGDSSESTTPTPTPDPSPTTTTFPDNASEGRQSLKAESSDRFVRRTRRASVSTAAVLDHEPLLHRPRESPAAGVALDKRLGVPARARRASVDVGATTSISLLSPALPLSRVTSRRSSVASSQGTPSTPSTPDPDSKTRDVTSFAFPPVTPTSSSSTRRHGYDVRPPPLLRRHSSDTLLLSPSPRHGQGYVTSGGMTSQGRHRRNSSLKLPQMQRRRQSVVPCVNNMLLLHGVLQNSSSFKAADFQE